MLKFTRLEDIPTGQNYIEADPESREIRIVDNSRNFLTISSVEGILDLIDFLTTVRERGENRSYLYVHEEYPRTRGIFGKLEISALKALELTLYLIEAEKVVNPQPYYKKFWNIYFQKQ